MSLSGAPQYDLSSREEESGDAGAGDADTAADDERGPSPYSSVCGTADVFHCCPTTQEVHEATLCNRLVMASFAVVLLWVSSLGVALSIVQYFVQAPSTDAVFSACSYAYQVSADERDSYVKCADRQIEACTSAFEESIEESLAEVFANSDYNAEILTSARAVQALCSAAATTAQAALGEWQVKFSI